MALTSTLPPTTLLLLLLASLSPAIARTLVFTPLLSLSHAPLIPQHSCIAYHGTYTTTAVYAYDEKGSDGIVSQDVWNALDSAQLVELDGILLDGVADGDQESPLFHRTTTTSATSQQASLIHVQQASLLDRTSHETNPEWLDRVHRHILAVYEQADLQSISSRNGDRTGTLLHPGDSPQRPLFDPSPRSMSPEAELLLSIDKRPELVYAPPSHSVAPLPSNNVVPSAFFTIPAALGPIADLLFPADTVLVAVPSYPLSLEATTSSSVPAPDWLSRKLGSLAFSTLVDVMLADIDAARIEKDVRHLTNEDGRAGWNTRHSFTRGARQAARWIKATVEAEGGAQCELIDHHSGFSPNVICTYRGHKEPESHVVMGAHYDSRGTFGHVRSPGGNDDGSGTSALLSLARLFKSYNIEFHSTVVLAFFSGEEQGLRGSKAYAKRLKDGKKNVRFMLQADMIGYHHPGEPAQLALPDRYDTIEARWLVGNLSTLYTPELQVGTTPACCSDHQSFNEQGFVSTWVFERNGPIADPRYHNSLDFSDREGYDFAQVATITKVMLATVLEVAGFSL